METRYIQLTEEDSKNIKKEILTVEMNLLNTIKKIRNYKILRKKENIMKTKLKSSFSGLKSKLYSIESSFPIQPTKEKDIKINIKELKTEKNKNKDIQEELEEIKKKLQKIS
ncbi:MAG: hypothetical protein ACP5OG_04725 [Candidatus Nanoarchaeia archaeon]